MGSFIMELGRMILWRRLAQF